MESVLQQIRIRMHKMKRNTLRLQIVSSCLFSMAIFLFLTTCTSLKKRSDSVPTDFNNPMDNRYVDAFLRASRSGVVYKGNVGDIFEKQLSSGGILIICFQLLDHTNYTMKGVLNGNSFAGLVNDTDSINFKFAEDGNVYYNRTSEDGFSIILGERIDFQQSLEYEKRARVYKLNKSFCKQREIDFSTSKTIFWYPYNYGTILRVTYLLDEDNANLELLTIVYKMNSNGSWTAQMENKFGEAEE